jgi:hypothetical protein
MLLLHTSIRGLAKVCRNNAYFWTVLFACVQKPNSSSKDGSASFIMRANLMSWVQWKLLFRFPVARVWGFSRDYGSRNVVCFKHIGRKVSIYIYIYIYISVQLLLFPIHFLNESYNIQIKSKITECEAINLS